MQCRPGSARSGGGSALQRSARRGDVAFVVLGLAFVALLGCGGSKQAARPQPSAKTQGPDWGAPPSFDAAGLTLAEHDLDGDGKTDHKRYLRRAGDPRSVARAEWDINHDGRSDAWLEYDAAGDLVEEHLDLDWDGRVDVVNHYQGGRLTSREVATNFQGKLSVRKHFDQGQLSTVEQDSDGNGKIDTWEFYEGGRLVRIGRDTNDDGVEDHFTEPTEEYRRAAEQAAAEQEAGKPAADPAGPPAGAPPEGAPAAGGAGAPPEDAGAPQASPPSEDSAAPTP